MRILWSAVSLLVVAGLALLLWSAASGTDRVEVVREGVSVSGTPAPDPSPGTVRRAEDPSSAPASPTGPADAGEDAPVTGTGDGGNPDAPVPPAEKPPAPPVPPAAPDPVPPAAPVPAPPAQVPLPVQPAPLDDDWDDDRDEDWDDDRDD